MTENEGIASVWSQTTSCTLLLNVFVTFSGSSHIFIPLISSHPSYYLSSLILSPIHRVDSHPSHFPPLPLIISHPSHYLLSLLFSLITLVSFIPLMLSCPSVILIPLIHSVIHLVLYSSILLIFTISYFLPLLSLSPLFLFSLSSHFHPYFHPYSDFFSLIITMWLTYIHSFSSLLPVFLYHILHLHWLSTTITPLPSSIFPCHYPSLVPSFAFCLCVFSFPSSPFYSNCFFFSFYLRLLPPICQGFSLSLTLLSFHL